MAIEEAFSKAESKMTKSTEALRRELASIRSGRATPALVEHLMVEYYGTPTPLMQIASISAPEARLIMIEPWDKGSLPSIERAILKSDLGINPSNDGRFIRLPLPPLSEERRRDLVKVVHKRVEEGKIALRNIRRDAIEEVGILEKSKQISEDEQRRTQAQLQKATDRFSAQMDQLGKAKEEEILRG